MRPRISDKSLRTLSIPDLSGGVNYRDGISQVLDNQLTDCRNVWYKNGLLRTRPGIKCAENLKNEDSDLINNFVPLDENEERKVYMKKENFRVINGITYFLVCIQYSDRLVFRYYADESHYIDIETVTDVPPEPFTCNIFKYNADIYCFCSGYYPEEETPFYIFKIVETGDEFHPFEVKRITDIRNEMYIPTIFKNGLPDIETATGNLFEGYNLLSPFARYYYSSVVDFVQRDTAAKFHLPFAPKRGSTVEVTFTSLALNTSVKHTVLIAQDGTGDENPGLDENENYATEDKLRLFVKGRTVYFERMGEDAHNPGVWFSMGYAEDKSYYLPNNVEIVVELDSSPEEAQSNYEKVLNNTFSEWFGGGAEGIYGGIHLFLGGNTKDEEKALVCWSDFNKPLYFSENGCAYPGDAAQKVVAFGKQGEQLIILKERETFATQYISKDEPISSDALTNQSVVDVTSAEVTFPMIQVHGFIGCDCPDSVQLCRNRLVWAHSDGKVYTLTSPSQWTERSIFEVSGMIEKQLRNRPEELRASKSADYDGHYLLSVGDRIFVMDYNSYGYTHVYSYSKEEDAQTRVPWWIWDNPQYRQNTYRQEAYVDYTLEPAKIIGMVTVGERLYMAAIFTAHSYIGASAAMIEMLTVDGDDDIMPSLVLREDGIYSEKHRSTTNASIPTMVQTKLFDFGTPTIRKTNPRTDVSFGNNEGIPITVTTVTDHGDTVREVVLDGEETDERLPNFFKNVAIRNGEKLVGRVGLRFETDGKLFLEAMTVYYKMLGGGR
jgi:hypothetical protein